MVADREVVRLAVLGGDVADVDLRRLRDRQRLADAIDQQVGQDAGQQAAGPDDDDVGLEDGADRLRVGLDVGGLEEDLLDARAALGDAGLAADHLVVLGAGVHA